LFKTTYQILHSSNHENDLPIEEVKPDNVVRTVHRVNIALYTDPGCQYLRPDMKGIILENRQQPENVFAGYTIHPTASTSFEKGMCVVCVCSRNGVCDESWYQSPETGEITYAWTSSLELIGRVIDD
jgi:hypothetical protein